MPSNLQMKNLKKGAMTVNYVSVTQKTGKNTFPKH